MRLSRSKEVLVLMGAVLVAAALAAVGISAVTSQTVMADGTNLHIRVIKTVANDFDSGWHIHPGPAIVQVQAGSFQITQGSCTPKTVGAGETYIETPFVPVRAVATGQIEWTTTLLGRYEDKLLTPVTSPCP
jgi:hypothetical protein